MTPLPQTISAEKSIEVASRRMSQLGVRHLPVLKTGVLCGVISERDILFCQSIADLVAERLSVEDVMSSEPFVVAPETPLGAVARDMARLRVDSAVIVDDDVVVGILTTTDALALLAQLADLAEPLPRRGLPRVVRRRILEEHVVLREQLATAAILADLVLDTGDESKVKLSLQAREFYHSLTRHLDLEDLILAPVLRAADAWGEVRAAALAEEHQNQRRHLKRALEQLETGDAGQLARAIQTFVPSVLEDMEREEEELLTEELLTDNTVSLGSGG